MSNHLRFYIDGQWVDPAVPAKLDVIDPSTEEAYTAISAGTAADVNRAVAAAKAAFPIFSQTTKAERLALLRKILEVYNERYEDIAQAVSREMGAPITWAREAQAWAGQAHMEATIKALENYEFSHLRGTTMVVKEPIGVCALITPWNWPLNQRTRSGSPTTRSTDLPLMCSPGISAAPARSRLGSARARSMSTIRTGTPSRRSAVTSNRATDANMPTGRFTTSSK
jgi:hypothetical protein